MDISLIFDWLGDEGGDVLRWWALATLAGLAVWPLLFRILGGLPDRGYTLARTAGLMLTGFVFWFLGSLGLLHNTPGGAVFAWMLVLGAGLVVFLRWDDRPPLLPWLRDHALLILLTEGLFLVLLFGWAAFRAHNPEMASTEKTMEMMFLNSIRRSETFPPHDAWLSGYAISYYYFGYLIAAMLANLSGVGGGIAFNTMLALLFALTGIGGLGVVYNMVRAHGSRVAALGAGLLALCCLIFMGNLGTALVELPYRGYTPGLVDQGYFDFWDLEDRNGLTTTSTAQGVKILPIDSDGDTVPNWDDSAEPLREWNYWWWFRYSRVSHDRDLNGDPIDVQPITEFPNFSFVLADMHPHVLALPFAVLAVGLALNLVLNRRSLFPYEIVLYAIWVGGLVFMNSWDAVYIVLLVGAEALRRLVNNGSGVLHRDDVLKTARFALVIGVLSLLFYLPWIISFTSQAGGILPNVIFPTPWQQFFVQFGVFLVILVVFLLVELRRAGKRFHWQAGLLAVTIVLGSGIIMAAILGVSAWSRDDVRSAVYAIIGQNRSLGDLVPDILTRRAAGLPSELLLLGFLFVVAGRLFVRPMSTPDPAEPVPAPYLPTTAFALLLVGAGAVLTFGPDFVYLRDNFSVRINTVFKLYYQGWIVFSLASAYAVWSVLAAVGKHKQAQSPLALVGRVAFGVGVIVLFVMGMTYPVLAAQSRALVETGRDRLKSEIEACDPTEAAQRGITCPELAALTLDGAPTLVSPSPGEYAAIQCLDRLVTNSSDIVIAEAPYPGGYAQSSGRTTGRVSALTGLPTLMGWENHERQWRGDTFANVIDARYENGVYRDRLLDIRELYTTQDWQRAWAIIDRYGIDYVVVGSAERQLVQDESSGDAALERSYTQGLNKFAQVLVPVCDSSEMTIYRVRPS